jgi:hypothetical protein
MCRTSSIRGLGIPPRHMSFQISLHAANVLLQNALGVPEGVVDRRTNIGVALVGVRLVADIDLLSIRQREVDMDLEEAVGPVMLPRIFHRHATGRNPAISFLKRRHVPRDLRVQRFLGGHASKIDVQCGFHLWLFDRCRAGVRARADVKLRMTYNQDSTGELQTGMDGRR